MMAARGAARAAMAGTKMNELEGITRKAAMFGEVLSRIGLA